MPELEGCSRVSLCEVTGCNEKRHGIFPECKFHFNRIHKPRGKFFWFPSHVGYATVMRILSYYPDRFDPSVVKEETITSGHASMITMKCLLCGLTYPKTIAVVFCPRPESIGCLGCNGNVWTLSKLRITLSDRPNIYLDGVTEDDIKGATTRLPLGCNICGHTWSLTIHAIATGGKGHGSGCSKCTGICNTP